MAYAIQSPGITVCPSCATNPRQHDVHFLTQFAIVPLCNAGGQMDRHKQPNFFKFLRSAIPTALKTVRDTTGLPLSFEISCHAKHRRLQLDTKVTVSNVTLQDAADCLVSKLSTRIAPRDHVILASCPLVVFSINVRQGLVSNLCAHFSPRHMSFQTFDGFTQQDHLRCMSLRFKVCVEGLESLLQACEEIFPDRYMYKISAVTWFLICAE